MSANLNNSDFRKLLETPRAERWGSETPSNSLGSAKGGGASKPAKQHGGENKPHKPGKPSKKPSGAKEEEEDDGPKYRDRAEERRRGKNVDYEEASELVSSLHSDVDLSRLSEAETKYLGGDMRFTHLVKGLDYALLEKARGDQHAKGADGGGEGGAPDPSSGRDAKARAAARANAAADKEPVRFATPIGRGVFNTLFAAAARAAAVREMYAPRRTAFVYGFDDEDTVDTDVPTTVRRPKSECPQVAEGLFAGVDTEVLDRIARVMSYVRTTADGRKLKKKERDAILSGGHAGAAAAAAGPHGAAGQAAQPTAAKPEQPGSHSAVGAARGSSAAAPPGDDGDDIFGDADGSEYVPTVNKKKEVTAAAAKGGYFAQQDTMDDIPMPGQPIRGRAAAASGSGPAAAAAGGGDDMDLEEGEMAAAPPPLPAAAPAAGPYPPGGPGAAYGGYGAQQQGAYYPAVQQQPQQPQPGAYGVYAGGYAAPQPQQPQQPNDAHLPPQFRSDPSKWRSRPKEGPAAVLAADDDDDAYGEYYPSMAGVAGGDAGEGEDEDFGAMDSKANKGQSRADFATDEEWQRYKETRETLPRAAFQFGMKRADGRKSHKELEKGAGKGQDKKLEYQLRKIERIMVDKGHDHTTAFKKPPAELAGGGGGGGGGGETPSMRKRQRI